MRASLPSSENSAWRRSEQNKFRSPSACTGFAGLSLHATGLRSENGSAGFYILISFSKLRVRTDFLLSENIFVAGAVVVHLHELPHFLHILFSPGSPATAVLVDVGNETFPD